MEVILGLLALVFLLSIFAAVVMFGIFMARKAGILPEKTLSVPQFNEDGTQLTDPTSFSFQHIKSSILFRFAIVAILTLLMSAPLDMVSNIVHERSKLHNNVVKDIANTWGHSQKLSGPTLLIPYTEKHIISETITDKKGNEQTVDKALFKHYTALVLPETLEIDARIGEEKRRRGLYESLVYRARLGINGYFMRPDLSSLSSHIETVHWDKAWLSLGISDTQAIKNTSLLNWNKATINFEPGTRITQLIKQGFHAPLVLDPEQPKFNYQFTIDANGSGGFYFEPFGKTSTANIEANWPHPSFQGSVLPLEHNITDQGFTAQWQIPHLARNYPQMWTLEKQTFDLHEFEAGVQLFKPVSLYTQIIRAIKYGILFIALTYITFLIFELGIKRRLHWVQYGVIGLALTVFYLALLSLSEHIRFLPAYLISAGVIICMISAYVYASIQDASRVVVVAALLTGLYAILYSLLKLEDYALLVGTGLLLVILAIMMYLTRHTGVEDHE